MDPAASTISVTSPSSESTSSAGPSQEATTTPRVARMSPAALAAKAYAAKVTSIPTSSASPPSKSSVNDGPKVKALVRPPSRVARARIAFLDAKCTIVREAVMPEGVPAKTYYHLMGKSLVNLKDILNKTFNSKINSPSPVVPRKRRSSVAAISSKVFDKPSKKAKKIIV